jgi:hypothetical protein
VRSHTSDRCVTPSRDGLTLSESDSERERGRAPETKVMTEVEGGGGITVARGRWISTDGDGDAPQSRLGFWGGAGGREGGFLAAGRRRGSERGQGCRLDHKWPTWAGGARGVEL